MEIKELVIDLPTGQTGQAQFTTQAINGVLKGVVLANYEGKMDIKIDSPRGYILYEEKDHIGCHYFPLKSTALNYKGEQYNFVADDYYLNEELVLSLSGKPNTNMVIVLKYI